jgi:hypothetical protein
MDKKRGNNERWTDGHNGTHAELPAVAAVQHVALYMRVSSEDQAERGTIHAQRDFLRQFAQLYTLTVVEEYADDGVTGTLPLAQRPHGQRLLQDVTVGRFGCVLVYRVDRPWDVRSPRCWMRMLLFLRQASPSAVLQSRSTPARPLARFFFNFWEA